MEGELGDDLKMKEFLSCIVRGNKLYFISEAELVLMRMDISSGEIEYIDNPYIVNSTGNFRVRWKLADRMLSYNKNIYILECDGTRMIEYHVEKNTCRYFDINCSVYVCSNYAGFTIYKDKAYIFPSFLNELVVVDLISGEVEREEKICKDISYIPDLKKAIPHKLFSCGCRIENSEWVFMEQNNEVIEYDLEKRYIQNHKIPKVIHGCVHAEWKDNIFYILDLEGKLYTWNVENHDVEDWLLDTGRPYPNYREMVVTKKKIWILPEIGEDILLIEKETRKSEKYYKYPSDFRYAAPENYSKYYVHCEDKENYYFSMHSGNYLFCVEKESGKERWIKPYFTKIKKVIDYYKKNSMFISEGVYTLSNYMKFIIDDKSDINGQVSYIGEKIWKGMK